MISIIYVVMIGWFLATLTNYLADILPVKRKPGVPVCLRCGSTISILNYLILTSKCSSCGYKTNKIRNWLVNLWLVVSSLYLWRHPNEKLGFYLSIIIMTYFLIIAVIDFEYRVILHPVSLFGMIFGIGSGIWMHGFINTIAGGIAGFLAMLFLYFLGILVIKLRQNKHPELIENEALGFGDVNLGGVLGLFLGYPAIYASLIITILSAGIVSFAYIFVMLARRKYSVNLSIPYGPFLLVAAIYLLFIY